MGQPDWNLATWEGARREALRRWSQMPLERIISALEEMEEVSAALHPEEVHPQQPSHGGSVT